jgi:thiamine monophosphate kinase
MKHLIKENDLVALIQRAFGPTREKPLRLALGDDAALWSATPGRETILTCDWFLEGTHFLRIPPRRWDGSAWHAR